MWWDVVTAWCGYYICCVVVWCCDSVVWNTIDVVGCCDSLVWVGTIFIVW